MIRILLVLPFLLLPACSSSNWQTASRESSGLAPKPEQLTESIFQIYTARAFSWRKYVAVHPWVAWKKNSDKQYTLAQVAGWRLRRGLSTVEIRQDVPDRLWYDNKPDILFSVRGEEADAIINQVEKIIEEYPYKHNYRLWPGPNSNTFVEHIIRKVPELTVELPPHAIGKDYLTESYLFEQSPGGKGMQLSLYGVLGMTLGLSEGVEINVLSMTFGVDILRPALKLPFVGRLGMDDTPL